MKSQASIDVKGRIEEICNEIFGLGHDKATDFNKTIVDGEVTVDTKSPSERYKIEVQKLTTLITDLIEGIDVPRKCMGKQLNITVQSTAFPTLSPKELIKNRQLQGEGWDMAIDQFTASKAKVLKELK